MDPCNNCELSKYCVPKFNLAGCERAKQFELSKSNGDQSQKTLDLVNNIEHSYPDMLQSIRQSAIDECIHTIISANSTDLNVLIDKLEELKLQK